VGQWQPNSCERPEQIGQSSQNPQDMPIHTFPYAPAQIAQPQASQHSGQAAALPVAPGLARGRRGGPDLPGKIIQAAPPQPPGRPGLAPSDTARHHSRTHLRRSHLGIVHPGPAHICGTEVSWQVRGKSPKWGGARIGARSSMCPRA
jgi:hypothetical protein